MSEPALLAEGPRWDAELGVLLWVDIEAGELHLLDPAGAGDRTHALGERVGAAAFTVDGRILAALESRLVSVDRDGGDLRELARIPHRRPGMRTNDGVCDPAGRFWVGSMTYDESPGSAALYRFEPGGRLETVLEGVGLSNGIGWSPDSRLMYYVDTLTGRVDVLDFDLASGRVAGRRPFVEVSPADGVPDGLTLDDEGAVWVALHGGGEVRRYLPDGRLDGHVPLPAERVTACWFGGDDGRRLFITTASLGLSEQAAAGQPLAGRVFALDVEVSGPAAHRFGHAQHRTL